MYDKNMTIEDLFKSVLKKFRDILDNPLFITNLDFFPPAMRILIDYLYADSLYNNTEVNEIIKNDMSVAGIYTPTELLLNPINCITKIDRKVRKGQSAAMVTEERELRDIMAKTQKEILAIQEEGKENNRLYMEAPVKIYSILDDMNIGKEAARKITEMISAVIMEIRTYKIDHSHVFIKLDKIKEEHRSLTREERLNLGLDEILQKQKEIKSSTDNLLLRLNSMIKGAGNDNNIREKVSQLNYILKNTIEVLPSIDYENIKAHNKLKNNLDRFNNEREEQITGRLRGKDSPLKKTLKNYISLIYEELIWDRELKKLKIGTDMLQRSAREIITREHAFQKLSYSDPKFFSSFVDGINPPCRIVIMQNSGRSYYNNDLGLLVIHNYLLTPHDEHSDIAQAFADALLLLNPGILGTFSSQSPKELFRNKSTEYVKKVFVSQYIKCFLERFSYTEPDEDHWAMFCNERRGMDFFTSQYFKTANR